MGLLMKLSRVAHSSPPRLRQQAICREKNAARAIMAALRKCIFMQTESKIF